VAQWLDDFSLRWSGAGILVMGHVATRWALDGLVQSRVAGFVRVSGSWRWLAALCAVVIVGGSAVVLAWPRQTLGVIYEVDERRWLDGSARVFVAGFWLVMGARRLQRRRLERS
jgi:hypothetical protein